MNSKSSTIAALLFLAPCLAATGAVIYTGGTYTQNFDSLASTGTAVAFTDDVTLPGWTAYNGETGYSGSGSFTFTLGTAQNHADDYRADNGANTTGDLISYGSTGSGERALGSLASGATDEFFITLQITNSTGLDVTSFNLGYVGEQWRRGANNPQRAESLLFYYRVGGTVFDATGTWTSVSALDFTSPEISGITAATLDGNAAANRTSLSQSVSVSLPAGQNLWLTWVDPDNSGTDHGLAIDNVQLSLTTVPEPGALILCSLAPLGLLVRRRR